MAQQTFSGVPGAFAAGAVLTAAEQELIRDFMIALIKEGMTGDTGEILPMIMDLTNNRVELDSGGLKFSDATTQTTAAVSGVTWSGSTANGLGTYGSSSSIVAESTATYDGTTLQLTTSGGGLKLDGLNSSNAPTLDDYEEGPRTVTMTASSSGSITMGSGDDLASYIKVGKMVTIFGFVEVTSISSPVGTLKIEGLPFTSGTSAEAAVRAGAAPFMTNMNSTLSPLFYYLGEGVTAMEVNSGSGDTVGNKDTTIADQVTASTQVGLSFTYYSDT